MIQQQLIFKDKDKPVQHLGLMDMVAELFPNKRNPMYSYSFLHLSIQEYLGAIYISLMDTSTQEQLLESMWMKEHLKNMAMFLAAITKFKGMNWESVKLAIQRDCRKDKGGILTLSRYSVQIVYESENVSLLEGHSLYRYDLSHYSPLFDFTALGYCIANSSYKWALRLGSPSGYMRTTSGVDLLVQALHHHSSSNYTIDSIKCWHKDTEFAQHFLAGLPHHTLPLIETLWLESKISLHLPMCLPELVRKMNKLRVLGLCKASAATLADTLQALATVPTHTIQTLNLSDSQFSPPVMAALCATLLTHSKSVAGLGLGHCGLTDDLACLLATTLQHKLPELQEINLADNAIRDKGAVAIVGALNGLPKLEFVNLQCNNIGDEGAVALAGNLNRLRKLREVCLRDNAFRRRGCMALEECKKNRKQLQLYY